MTVPVELRQLADTELSLPSRVRYVALMLLSLAMAAIVAALWLTEPALPLRTQIAFAVLIGIGAGWIAFAGWVLTHRRILLAGHRIVAGRMAVAFCSVFLLGAVAAGYTTGRSAGYAAAAQGAVLLAVAIAVLVRARREFARLMARRDALERELNRTNR